MLTVVPNGITNLETLLSIFNSSSAVFNVTGIVAIELLAAAQGLEFRHPLKSSSSLEELFKTLRTRVDAYDEDRFFAPDIEAIKSLVKSSALVKQFADLLSTVASAASDSKISQREARAIRREWEKLKRIAEGYVQCCEGGSFKQLNREMKRK